MMEMGVEDLEAIAREIRVTIVDMLYRIGQEYRGHPGPALSIADIVTCLYFKVLNIVPQNPRWPDRDRFILSKGHACPALYAALALRGFFDKKHLYSLRHVGSILQGHPDMRKTPGIDMTTGSLGHGLSAGVGVALSARLDGKLFRTYVLLGDGELQEGLVWEAAMAARHYRLDNLIAIIDRNRWQSCGSVERTMNLEPLSSKWDSFGWKVLEIDGHDIKSICSSLSVAHTSKPLAIIANTVKGKGVSFMEEDNSWHQRPITRQEHEKAMSELQRK